MPKPSLPVDVRFWSKVTKLPGNGCWLWTRAVDKDGYGKFQINLGGSANQEHVRAHRFSWEMKFGQIPDGLFVLHKCDTPACVRPDHLFLGTQADNRADCIRKLRQPRGESSHNAKLTTTQVLFIKRNPQIATRDLADKFGVRPITVNQIRAGRNWRHVR